MHDIRDNLGPLWRMLSRTRSVSDEVGRTVMFVAARNLEGTSSAAASFALLAAARSNKHAWLVDLDLRRNPQFEAFSKGFARDVGAPGRPFDASLRAKPFYAIGSANRTDGADSADKLLCAHEIDKTNLLVTRFRNERIKPGQKVGVRTQPDWWKSIRKVSDWAVVDAPALERSPAALAMASQMDMIVMVVKADRTSADDILSARRELEAHGGNVIGITMTNVRADARFAQRFES